MARSDAERLVASLADPAFYPHRPATVRHLQTHLSHVFVGEPYAYKLKKAVRYSFADLSTRERRLEVSLDEVRLNRRLCEPVYLGVLPIVRTADGGFALGAPIGEPNRPPASSTDEAVDHLVWMRALPASGMGREALAAGRLEAPRLEAFARDLALFHAAAAAEPPDAAATSLEALERRWDNVLRDAAPMVGRFLPPEDRDVLADFGPSFVRRHAAVFEARAQAGRVRDGHGDLHLGNLCLVDPALPAIDRAPAVPAALYAFDCIEFSRELRVNDVASEVAFLAMDLEASGRADLSRAFVAAYVAASDDRDLEIVLPFFTSYRAAVRGMVLGLSCQSPDVRDEERLRAESESRHHFALATACAWRAAGPAIVACTGLSGSGKTAVATRLAGATGFALLSSDDIRKRRAGLDPAAPAPASTASALYGAAARRRTYEALAAAVREHVARGEPVIADATFIRAADRGLLSSVARDAACEILFVECRVDDATARARLAARAATPTPDGIARSDADARVREMQERERDPFAPDEPHLVLDTACDLEELRGRAVRAAWAWRRAQPVHATAGGGTPR